MRFIANGVCAIIISFNDHVECIKCIESIHSQVERTIIVDNGSEELHIKALANYAEGKKDLTLCRLSSNRGIATAINIGLTWAKDRGYKYMLTLDQDSIAAATMVREMLCALVEEKEIANEIVGARVRGKVGYRISHMSEMVDNSQLSESNNRKLADRLISSGMLINERIISKIGLMNGSYFIDSVDQEYCLRARRFGIRCMVVKKAILYHDIGKIKKRQLLSFSWRSNVHSWERMYYISRNHVHLWRKHGIYFPKLVLIDMINDIKAILDLMLFEKHRSKYLKMIILGYLHGIIGRSGPLYQRARS